MQSVSWATMQKSLIPILPKNYRSNHLEISWLLEINLTQGCKPAASSAPSFAILTQVPFENENIE